MAFENAAPYGESFDRYAENHQDVESAPAETQPTALNEAAVAKLGSAITAGARGISFNSRELEAKSAYGYIDF